MAELTASKLDLSMQCLYWLTIDLPSEPLGRAGVFGAAFAEMVATGKTYQPLSNEEEVKLQTCFRGWLKMGKPLLPSNPRHEVAYAISLDGTIRELGLNIGRRYRQHGAQLGDICLSVDVVGDWVVDHKTSRKYVDAYEAWQLRAAAIATGCQRVEFHYVSRATGRTTVDRADYTADEIKRFKQQLLERAYDLLEGRTAAAVGPHCTEHWCPARTVCPALRGAQQITQKEKTNMSKMALANIQKGKQETPFCLCLYAPEGVGKSTFAAGAPSPIFLCEKDGTAHLDVARFEVPETFAEARQALDVLMNDKHSYKTFVLDTADWLEPLIHEYVCKEGSKKSIEDFGYGKGYVAALDEWRAFLAKIDQLRSKRGMHIIVLAHSQVKTFRNPLGDDFERYELKLHGKAAALLKEWPNAVLFANYSIYTHKDDKGRVRGVGDGSRLIYTEHRPAWDAKNRYGLPPEFPLDWDEFERAARAGEPITLDKVSAEIAQLIEQADDKLKEQARGAITRCGKDAQKLAKLADWLRGKLQQAA